MVKKPQKTKKTTPDWSMRRFNGIPDSIFSEAATFAASLKFCALAQNTGISNATILKIKWNNIECSS